MIAAYQLALVLAVLVLARFLPLYLSPLFAVMLFALFNGMRISAQLDRYPAAAKIVRNAGRRIHSIAIWSGRKLGAFLVTSPAPGGRKVVVRPLYIPPDPAKRNTR